jgi:hypothetical protein
METTLLNAGNIIVTNARFVVNAKTYAMRNVTSVESKATYYPPKRGWAYLCFALGAAFALNAPGAPSPVNAFLITVAPFVVAGVLLWRRAKARTVWTVWVHTSGVQEQAFSTEDQALHGQIVQALNDAMVR